MNLAVDDVSHRQDPDWNCAWLPAPHPAAAGRGGLNLSATIASFTMSMTLRTILATTLTYAITRAGSGLLHFNPVERFTLWPGLVIALSIWLVVFAICGWIIDQVWARLFR